MINEKPKRKDTAMNTEGIKAKAAKILNLLNNAGTEGEAVAASLALQRLLLSNGLTIVDVEVKEDKTEVLDANTGYRSKVEKWELWLANTVAKNYRCETLRWTRRCGRQKEYQIVFLGEGDDAANAVEVYLATRKAALKCLRLFKKSYVAERQERDWWYETSDFSTAERNSYLFGFVQGLSSAYDEQIASDETLALAVVVPKRVTDELNNRATGHVRQRYSRQSGDGSIYNGGYSDGYGVGTGKRVCA